MRNALLFALPVSALLLTGAVPKGAVPDLPFPMNERLLTPGGQPTSLAEQAGGEALAVVVIKGTHCRVCLDELVRLKKRADDIAATGGRLVALSADAPEEHAAVIERLDLPFPILTDEGGAVAKTLGFWMKRRGQPLPGVWWLDRCGNVARRYEGRWPGREQTEMILDGLRKVTKRRVCGTAA